MNAVIVTSTQIKKVDVHTLITSLSSKCQLKIQKVFISNQYDLESQHSYLFVLQKKIKYPSTNRCLGKVDTLRCGHILREQLKKK